MQNYFAPPNQFIVLPLFIRIPGKNQRCPITGLSRSAIYRLIQGDKPLVGSLMVTLDGGPPRGTRLILFGSLLEYLLRNGRAKGDVIEMLPPAFRKIMTAPDVIEVYDPSEGRANSKLGD